MAVLKEIMRRSAWVTVGSVIGRALPIAASMTLAHKMGLGSFALVGLILTWAAIMPSLTTAGIGLVVTQLMAHLGTGFYKSVLKKGVITAIVAIAAVLGAIGLVGEETLSRIYPGMGLEKLSWGVLAIGVLSCFFHLTVSFFSGAHKPRTQSLFLAVLGIGQGIALWVAVLTSRPDSVVINLMVAYGVVISVAIYVVYRTIYNQAGEKTFQIGWSGWTRKVVPAILSTATVSPVALVCASFLADEPGGARELGAFFALEQLSMFITYVPSLIVQSSLPVISSEFGRSRWAAARHAFVMAGCQFAVLVVIVAVSIAFAGHILALYGELREYKDAFSVMLFNLLLTVPLATIGIYFQASGRFATGSVINLIWSFVFMMGSYLLQTEGVVGIQIARFIATVVLAVTTFLLFAFYWKRGEFRTPE